jgi:hypothetical protein
MDDGPFSKIFTNKIGILELLEIQNQPEKDWFFPHFIITMKKRMQ